MYTVLYREVWRFIKVWNQTLIAPMVNALLFLAIFNLALGGGQTRVVEGMNYNQFIAPGLIMMAIVQNAFANTSSSFTLSKIQGIIIDYLMPPISAGELTFAMTMGGVARGVLVGVMVSTAVYLFVPIAVYSWAALLYYVLAASMLLALIGMLAGIWAQSFDQVAAITNYVITPLAFLSGTFYSVRNLPPFLHHIAHFDPFFYMIDGFRYALTGFHDGDLEIGAVTLLTANAALWILVNGVLRRGYRLKS